MTTEHPERHSGAADDGWSTRRRAAGLTDLAVRALAATDPALIAHTDGGGAWHGDPTLWQQYLAENSSGARTTWVADLGTHIIGYVSLVLDSAYPPFRAAGVPEINNLVVHQAFRGSGVGTALIGSCLDAARGLGAREVGIGVGLYADYGSAQSLYVKLGWVRDKQGITYRHRPVTPGSQVRVDDDLVLWLRKSLG